MRLCLRPVALARYRVKHQGGVAAFLHSPVNQSVLVDFLEELSAGIPAKYTRRTSGESKRRCLSSL